MMVLHHCKGTTYYELDKRNFLKATFALELSNTTEKEQYIAAAAATSKEIVVAFSFSYYTRLRRLPTKLLFKLVCHTSLSELRNSREKCNSQKKKTEVNEVLNTEFLSEPILITSQQRIKWRSTREL